MLGRTYRLTACPEAQSTKAAGLLRAARPATKHVPFSSATSNSRGSSSHPNEYFGSDGRRKSTIEEGFSPDTKGSLNTAASGGRQPPWEISWQTNESSMEWNDDIKQRLLTRVTAEKLNITEEAMSQKLRELQRLLPNLLQKMAGMGPDLLAQLSADPPQLAEKLLQLKIIFPEADTSRMVSNQISLVLKADLQKVAAAAEELRSILPNVNVDRLVQDNPVVLDVAAFQKTMQHARQIMGPDLDIIDSLKRRPEMIFQFQQGKDIIPYDEVPTHKGQI
ncbi:TPA: hypothetical protein ACH3X1_011882 [Trebouxia sp. C0004]